MTPAKIQFSAEKGNLKKSIGQVKFQVSIDLQKKNYPFLPSTSRGAMAKDLGQDSIIICFNDFNPINVLKRGLED